jgi:putative ATP-dependent endonuclease of OLD family
MTATCNTLTPLIRRLTIERFRGIEGLVWYPEPGVNVILGGGDVGKTTILDAIALVLSPTNTTLLADADYWRREVENGFCIEAVMSLPETCGISQQTKNTWPWEWDGKEPKLPKVDEDPSATSLAKPVYRLRVRGTADFDLAFEVLQPDDTADHLAVAVRRKIGLVRLSGDDRNDRDLRLIQGSALDRLLSDKTLRSRLGHKLAESDVEEELKEDAKSKLSSLDEAFQKQALPTGLSLGLTGGQGLSLNALIGLTATKDKVKLPVASWGAGTRRLAALEIGAARQGETPITLVDEVERGFEPYRQRVLMAELQKRGSQVFLTTHSAAVVSAASNAALWYVDSKGAIGRLPASVASHQKRDPETFLARVAVIAEGSTEVGFVTALT